MNAIPAPATASPSPAGDADSDALLASLVSEMAGIWRAGNQRVRDNLRKQVLHVLGRYRPPVDMPARNQPPKPITDDGWFTEQAQEFEVMDRDQLLFAARLWAFNAQQATLAAARDKAGTDAIVQDANQALARVTRLLTSKATVRTDDLRIALGACETCSQPGEVIWRGRIYCAADRDQLMELMAPGQGPVPE